MNASFETCFILLSMVIVIISLKFFCKHTCQQLQIFTLIRQIELSFTNILKCKANIALFACTMLHILVGCLIKWYDWSNVDLYIHKLINRVIHIYIYMWVQLCLKLNQTVNNYINLPFMNTKTVKPIILLFTRTNEPNINSRVQVNFIQMNRNNSICWAVDRWKRFIYLLPWINCCYLSILS